MNPPDVVEFVAKAMQSRGGYDTESWDRLSPDGKSAWFARADHAITALDQWEETHPGGVVPQL